jgi:hypothetical protein
MAMTPNIRRRVTMKKRFSTLGKLLCLFTATLAIQGFCYWAPWHSDYYMTEASDGVASLDGRVRDFPRTWLAQVDVDVTSPGHWVRLKWAGPLAEQQDRGPFHASPGKGNDCNCNKRSISLLEGSLCTPKGMHVVQGFSDCMRSLPECTFVTWIVPKRGIALHYHRERPVYPASSGCVRLGEQAAQLIHNNSIAGRTKVYIHGTWTGRVNTSIDAAK